MGKRQFFDPGVDPAVEGIPFCEGHNREFSDIWNDPMVVHLMDSIQAMNLNSTNSYKHHHG